MTVSDTQKEEHLMSETDSKQLKKEKNQTE